MTLTSDDFVTRDVWNKANFHVEHAHPLHVSGKGEVFWCDECQRAYVDMRPTKWDLWESVLDRKVLGLS